MITLQKTTEEHLPKIFEIAFGQNSDKKWFELDAPYFDDPKPQTYEEFLEDYGLKWAKDENSYTIFWDDKIVGTCVAYFDDGKLKKWLELGICIYDSTTWGKGVGTKAISLLTTIMFKRYPDIQRVGITTWSGNIGMIKVAEKLGFTLEARIRKVRYYKNEYFDSIRMGILREEWSSGI